MAKELKCIDIGHVPELVRIVEEVQAANEPRVLRRNSEDVAILLPAKSAPRRAGRTRTKADHDAFLASAGTWKGLVDVEAFTSYIDERRRSSSRPPVEL